MINSPIFQNLPEIISTYNRFNAFYYGTDLSVRQLWQLASEHVALGLRAKALGKARRARYAQNQLTPTPKQGLQQALAKHPTFSGLVCVTSYVRTVKNNLVKKETAFRVVGSTITQLVIFNVHHFDLFVDIRNAQLQQGEVGIAFAPELVTA